MGRVLESVERLLKELAKVDRGCQRFLKKQKCGIGKRGSVCIGMKVVELGELRGSYEKRMWK